MLWWSIIYSDTQQDAHVYHRETFRLHEYLQATADMQTYLFVCFEPLTYIVNSDLEVKNSYVDKLTCFRNSQEVYFIHILFIPMHGF